MGSQGLIKVILALVFVCKQGLCETNTLFVTELTACNICVCGPGPSQRPKELMNCTNLNGLVKVKSLPPFIRAIRVTNAQHGVIFERGAIRVREKSVVFKVTVEKSSQVDFREKSTTILVGNGTVHFNLKEIAHLKMRSRAVSSSSVRI